MLVLAIIALVLGFFGLAYVQEKEIEEVTQENKSAYIIIE